MKYISHNSLKAVRRLEAPVTGCLGYRGWFPNFQ